MPSCSTSFIGWSSGSGTSARLLVVEEAWITALNSLFGQTIEEWLRTLRKKNAAVVFVSQSVADVVDSLRRDIVLESCPTKILLPNPEAESEQVRRLYERIGLNRRQIRMLATAVRSGNITTRPLSDGGSSGSGSGPWP